MADGGSEKVGIGAPTRTWTWLREYCTAGRAFRTSIWDTEREEAENEREWEDEL